MSDSFSGGVKPVSQKRDMGHPSLVAGRMWPLAHPPVSRVKLIDSAFG